MTIEFRRLGRPEDEVKIETLEPGDPFRYDTLEGSWVYGHVIFKNACRVRVVLYNYTGPSFDHADDHSNSRKKSDRELNLPIGMGVERIPDLNDNEPEPKGGDVAENAMKAAGLVAKYNHQQRQWQKATDAGDKEKAEVAAARIVALEEEAKAQNVELPEWDTDRARAEVKIEMNGVHKDDPNDGFPVIQKTLAKGKLIPGRDLTEEEKKEMLAASKKAKAARGKAQQASTPEAKREALSKTKPEPKPKKSGMTKTHDCLCGCGRETQSLYAPGHDARVKGILLKVERGELGLDIVPDTVAPFVRWSGKWKAADFTLEAAPVKIPGRPEVDNTSQQALEALDV